MSVDLSELIPNYWAEVNAPGEDAFPDATDDDALLRLQNAFWETVLDGIISGYSVDDDGIVTPNNGSTDLSRELQSVIVFYAGISTVRNALRTLNVNTRSVAGPVEFEVQKSANMLRDILKELKDRRNLILTRLSDMGVVDSFYFDAMVQRTDSIDFGDIYSGFYDNRY